MCLVPWFDYSFYDAIFVFPVPLLTDKAGLTSSFVLDGFLFSVAQSILKSIFQTSSIASPIPDTDAEEWRLKEV